MVYNAMCLFGVDQGVAATVGKSLLGAGVGLPFFYSVIKSAISEYRNRDLPLNRILNQFWSHETINPIVTHAYNIPLYVQLALEQDEARRDKEHEQERKKVSKWQKEYENARKEIEHLALSF